MNQAILQVIKNEVEKIENGTGRGTVLIEIVNGVVHTIKPTPTFYFGNICQTENGVKVNGKLDTKGTS